MDVYRPGSTSLQLFLNLSLAEIDLLATDHKRDLHFLRPPLTTSASGDDDRRTAVLSHDRGLAPGLRPFPGVCSQADRQSERMFLDCAREECVTHDGTQALDRLRRVLED